MGEFRAGNLRERERHATAAPAQDFLAFWGKARPQDDSGPLWHPLAYHLLDVAACSERLLANRPNDLSRVAALLGLPRALAERLLVVLVALHDLGKFCPAFQALAPDHWPDELGNLDDRAIRRIPHTDAGLLLWQERLAGEFESRIWPGAASRIEPLALAVFGHHGKALPTPDIPLRVAFGDRAVRAASECGQALLDLLLPEPIEASPPPRGVTERLSWWLAGLTSTADWLGSGEQHFRYAAPTHSLARYWVLARSIAGEAVAKAGMEALVPAGEMPFSTLTGKCIPTPVQSWAEHATLPEGPLLVIVEDVTGSGKTEAAQMIVHRLISGGRVRGAYWAMPTQATANAMYVRQAGVLVKLYAAVGPQPSLVLAHGQARLHEAFRRSVLYGDEVDAGARPGEIWDEELPASAACAAFLADDRRTSLLADLGAGTIDQALLAVLPTRYNTIRLFGLANKVLVVDEAHAFDAYVSTELEGLLEFQAALGGCAIVLSATLPDAKRRAFAAAWSRGLGTQEGVGGRTRLPGVERDEVRTRQAYPLVTVVGADLIGCMETAVAAAPKSARSVPIRLVPDPEEVVGVVAGAARDGCAVAWIRNTVDSCIGAAERLRGLGLEPIVFHARFAQGDRQEREREVIERFKASAEDGRRAGGVVVATQVIEQSLDLDFDVMVSDLAPVDLLIQRAGRLWRNPARGPDRRSGARCELVVLGPPFTEAPPEDWLRALLPGTDAVYPNVGVLWRTLRALGRTLCIRTPDGLRELVEAVYGCEDVPESLLGKVLESEGKASAGRSQARHFLLRMQDGYHGDGVAWRDEVRIPTRLGEERLTVRLGRVRDDGSVGPWYHGPGMPEWKQWALSEVAVSSRRLPAGAQAVGSLGPVVEAARRAWRTFEQGIPLIPLLPGGAGTWTGELAGGRNGRCVRVQYSRDIGLTFGSRERARGGDGV